MTWFYAARWAELLRAVLPMLLLIAAAQFILIYASLAILIRIANYFVKREERKK